MYKKGSKHKLATNYISTNGTWPNEVRKIECTTPEFPGSNTFIIGKGSYLIGCAFSRMQPSAMVLIGNYCSMGRELCLMIGMDHDYHSASTFPFHVLTSGEEEESFPSFQPSSAWPSGMFGKKKDWIVIGNDVWIGAKTTILGGVHIGNGAVIGANTVIAKDVPPYSVVVGNPQRVIKYRFSHDIIQKLQSIKWWYWPTEELVHVHAAENEAAVQEFVKCYYKEQTPIKNEFTIQMENWRKDGMKLYYFRVPENDPSLYSHVCKKFLQAYAKHSKMRLLVEIPSGNPSLRETLMGSFVTLLSQSLQLSSAQAEKFQKTKFPLLFCEIKNKAIPLEIFPNIDYFLITQDFFSLIYIDFAKDNDVNLLYAYDLHLFED